MNSIVNNIWFSKQQIIPIAIILVFIILEVIAKLKYQEQHECLSPVKNESRNPQIVDCDCEI